MRKIGYLAAALTAIGLLLMPIQIHAAVANTSVSLVIPDTCTLDVKVEGAGSLEVTVDGETVKIASAEEIILSKHQMVQIKGVPHDGFVLKDLTLNGKELLAEDEFGLYWCEVSADSTLKAVFHSKPENKPSESEKPSVELPTGSPQTGDPSVHRQLMAGASVILSIVPIVWFLKKTKKDKLRR